MKYLKKLTALCMALAVALIPVAAMAQTEYKTDINWALTYFKEHFEAQFHLPVEDYNRLSADVWYLEPLYVTDNLDNPEYTFLKPMVDFDADVASMAANTAAKQVLTLAVTGEDFQQPQIEALCDALAAGQTDSGAFTDSHGNPTATDTAWAVTALQIAKNRGAAAEYDAAGAAAYLESAMTQDGGYNDYGAQGNVDTTGMVMVALNTLPGETAARLSEKCVAFMESCLRENGALVGRGVYDSENSCSQSYGIIGLLAAGEDLNTGTFANVVPFLMQFQSDQGGFWYDAASMAGTGWYTEPDYYSTYQAMLALSDLALGENLWVKLATPTTVITPDPPTGGAAADDLAGAQTPPMGTTGINPVLIVVLIAAAVIVIGAVTIPMIQKKKDGTKK